MLWGQRQVQPKWGHQVPSALRVQANDQLSVPADLNFLGIAQSEYCNIMQNGSKEKPDTDQSLAKTQLNNTKVALSSEYWASHALPKNESNLPLWMWAGWKPYQTQPHKVVCFLIGTRVLGRMKMLTTRPRDKEQDSLGARVIQI